MHRSRNDSRHGMPSGFTLVELLTVMIIIVVLAALAMPKFQDMRREARGAAIRSLAGRVANSMSTIQTVWHVHRANPVAVGDQSFAVNDTGRDVWSNRVSDGSPTADSMFVLIGCGNSPPPTQTVVTCPNMPGYSAVTYGSELTIWPSDVPQPDGVSAACYVDYWPAYNFDPAWTAPSYVNLNGTVKEGYEFETSGC